MSNNLAVTDQTSGTRPRWSIVGGGSLLTGALVLLVATILEYFVWHTDTLATGVFVLFSILFLANIVLYLVAMVALGFADGGIAGPSIIGRTGLVLFGVGWAVQQIIYWSGYFTGSLPTAVTTLSIIALIVTYLGAIAAAVVIALGGVVGGLARWALIIGFAIAGICAGIANSQSDQVLTTVLLSLSCVAQAFVGLSYLRSRRRPASL
ncbi:hypothetical protein [Compostimonas suwonensis]|uniref:Uncharacterized protein n=1 Tax=Compostimonas suwonensis TaxID=1048394 RepID=A0A2M9BZD0_9MICO|nr:hypothetical protein [Compostimonas suwonensis]PJJ63434.1 hypothetical protein CLV54_1099 [Compostimonas suwonensis]